MMNKNRKLNGNKGMSTTAKEVPLWKRQTTPEILKGYSFSHGNSSKVLESFSIIKLVYPLSMNTYQMEIYALLDNNALIQFLA